MHEHPLDALAHALEELDAHGLESRYYIVHQHPDRTDVRVYVDDREAFLCAFSLPPESAALKVLTMIYNGVEFINVKEKV